MERYRFIDSDAHVFEPQSLWNDYLEPKYRGVIKAVVDYQGDPLAFGERIEVGGYTIPNNGVDPMVPLSDSIERFPSPGLEDAYDRYARQGFPPPSIPRP